MRNSLALFVSVAFVFGCGDDGSGAVVAGAGGAGGEGGAGGGTEPFRLTITIEPELPCEEGVPSFYEVSAQGTSKSRPGLVVGDFPAAGGAAILGEAPQRLLFQNDDASYDYHLIFGEAVVDTLVTLDPPSSLDVRGALETCEPHVLE